MSKMFLDPPSMTYSTVAARDSSSGANVYLEVIIILISNDICIDALALITSIFANRK